MIDVLVVDDDYHVAHAHALAIARVEGFRVVGEAHSGGEAERLVVDAAPDLLLLDMYLPDFTGLDLVRRLTAAGRAVPDFLLVTAARDLESVRTSMQLGAFYYLVKPFTFAALREQLEAYRAWTERLQRAPAGQRDVDQEVVDSLYSLRSTPSRTAATVRGLQPTMARVLEIVTAAPRSIGAAEVAERLGASRPTAQRYLATLVRKQLIDLDLSYGSTGRPEHRYVPRRR
ncbi:response regulator [Terrabacter sp. 2RAF25]|uniref:response regulator n=1 Tax=Terrabacter sp. 2RAF25 TaxID=3232998 RepID=UPI003F947AC6